MIQAVILAGGQATRMRPFTDDRPKAMVEVAGKPIIERQIAWLSANGVEHIVVSCGYRADVIREYLGDGASLGTEVTYAVEEEPLGRGGGLKFGASQLPHPDQVWMGLNGDVIADFSLGALLEQHNALGTAATLCLAPHRSNWGVADLEGDLIRGFVEKPVLPYWINAGIYCMSPAITKMLPDKGDHEDTTFPELAREGKLGAFRIQGYWRGIDTAKDVTEASAELA